MKYSFLFKHWITTLVLSPLLLFIYSFFQSELYDFYDHLEVFFIFLLFSTLFALPISTLFALPTVFISFVLFYFIDKKRVQISIVKFVIILTTIIGTFLTLYIVSNTIAVEYSIVYSIVAILSATLFKIKRVS